MPYLWFFVVYPRNSIIGLTLINNLIFVLTFSPTAATRLISSIESTVIACTPTLAANIMSCSDLYKFVKVISCGLKSANNARIISPTLDASSSKPSSLAILIISKFELHLHAYCGLKLGYGNELLTLRSLLLNSSSTTTYNGVPYLLIRSVTEMPSMYIMPFLLWLSQLHLGFRYLLEAEVLFLYVFFLVFLFLVLGIYDFAPFLF